MILRLALAQINPTVGDFSANFEKILDYSRRAGDVGADIVVFPEMALTGYPPEDLLLEPLFIAKSDRALARLTSKLPPDLPVVVGAPQGKPGRLTNSALLIYQRRVRERYHKWLLPNYGVFDEQRYFQPGTRPGVFDLGGTRLGLTVCEDVWHPRGPALAASKAGAKLIINLSASPYHHGKQHERVTVLRTLTRETRAAVAYCNMVGGQDELVYDGGSLVLDPEGRVTAQAPLFQEHLLVTDMDVAVRRRPGSGASLPSAVQHRPPCPESKVRDMSNVEEIYTALVTGTGDYVKKNGFSKAVVGLSGGIDSSLVASIAADALGNDNVVGVTLPSRFNSKETRRDAEKVAENLDINFLTVPIDDVVHAFQKTLSPLFAGRAADVTEENLQSRVRGALLMALSNKFGWLVLTTGNKSELSTGYFTLYGDSAGGFAVIKDIPKTLVYDLARWRNERPGTPPIPLSVIERAPTAELRPHQKDQDTLPPYDVLDGIVSHYIERNHGLAEIVKGGVDPALASKTLRTIDAMEFKRRQAPLGIKITPRAFGRDRRMPITNRFRPYDA